MIDAARQMKGRQVRGLGHFVHQGVSVRAGRGAVVAGEDLGEDSGQFADARAGHLGADLGGTLRFAVARGAALQRRGPWRHGGPRAEDLDATHELEDIVAADAGVGPGHQLPCDQAVLCTPGRGVRDQYQQSGVRVESDGVDVPGEVGLARKWPHTGQDVGDPKESKRSTDDPGTGAR